MLCACFAGVFPDLEVFTVYQACIGQRIILLLKGHFVVSNMETSTSDGGEYVSRCFHHPENVSNR